MKKNASIKKLIIFLLIITTISCNSDDPGDMTEEVNSLVLKSITTNNGLRSEFDTSGRLISVIANENSINESRIEHLLDDNGRIITKFKQLGGIQQNTNYQYDISGNITQTTETNSDDFSTTETITEFAYNTNTIIATNTENNEDFQNNFIFSDDTYSEISSFKAINLTSGIDLLEETYLYTNGNLQKTTIISSVQEQLPSTFKTYEYDDTINPRIEGNQVDYLNELFLFTRKNTQSLTTVLVNFSKNNRLTSFVENSTITLEYNDQNYIIQETETRNEPNPAFEPHIINYEYY